MRYIDLFCGIGGFRKAMEAVGGECVFSSDIDKFARETYKENFGDYPEGDITKISENDVPDFDILLGGFPCQPFSYSGRNEGFEDKTRGTLFFDILRILKNKRPKMFLLENVKGLKSHNGGETLKVIENSLIDLGYDIHWKILNSHDFGVPQKRERWYCVGFDKTIDFKFPVGNKKGSTLREIIDVNINDESLNITDFELERIKYHFNNAEEIRVKHDSSKYNPNTKKGKHGVFSFQKPDGSLRFHVGDRSKTQIQEAFYSCLDTYACTIIANRVPKLWDIGRKLSVKEAARIQGFPDDFKFPVSNAQAYKQLGNAVVVTVVQEILKTMKDYYINEYQEDTAINESHSVEVAS
ncbi:DNA (cytosine-5-)-methyltransferase [Winogradskyella helgolandensis]|uniref:DNA (cytosine-5-)-methyltransferase n=1 Tax=Winogradskyella helgolandensis TaxID=2697010 RepID=UPI0015C835FA|nr:DNA (cytosine-5-)-methyltransferase [Winogradskyella helgolandensis]